MKYLDIKKKYESMVIQRDYAKNQLKKQIKDKNTVQETLINTEKARVIFTTTAKMTQQNMQLYISEMVSIALKTVVDNPPEFIVEIIERKNKTDVSLMFKRGEKLMTPLGSSGGGLLDLTSFALRIAMWSLNKNRSTIILDEPFKYLSENYQAAASKLVKTLSDRLKIQFIIVSHQNDAVACADRVFKITRATDYYSYWEDNLHEMAKVSVI